LDTNNSAHAETLTKIKRRLRQETFTSDYIFEIINGHPELVRSLYLSFANQHYVQTRGEEDDFIPTLSYQRLQVGRVLNEDELGSLISTSVGNEHQEKVMQSFIIFNQNVL
jgi:glutamate dehydrogenase